MKIAFCSLHPFWHGLANNGGSRTILLSCEALNRIGHKAVVVTETDRFTWFKHPKPEETVSKDADVLVAVAISDVPRIMKYDRKLAYWARPFESWQYPKKTIYRILRDFPGTIMVNSSWQKVELRKHGIKSTVVFAGIDFGRWKNQGKPRHSILCRYSENPVKGYKNFKKMKRLMPEFGYSVLENTKHPERYYNDARYFVAPGKTEGWNNCAAEAALCGCRLVVADNPHNGTFDFVTHENSIVYKSIEEAVQRIRRAETGINEDVCSRLRAIGTREECMEKMICALS